MADYVTTGGISSFIAFLQRAIYRCECLCHLVETLYLFAGLLRHFLVNVYFSFMIKRSAFFMSLAFCAGFLSHVPSSHSGPQRFCSLN